MALIQNPSIGRKLMRALRLTSLPDSVLAPETVPVILVEDLSAPLSDVERGCMGADDESAFAAQNSIGVLVRVGAPASYDLTVTAVHFSSPTAQAVRLIVPTAGVVGLTVSAQTSFTDFNIAGRPTSQMGRDTQIGVPAGRILGQYLILADTHYRIPVNIRIGTIGQGDDLTSLMIAALTVNTDLTFGFEWTESLPLG